MFQYIVLIGICLMTSSCGKKGPVEPLESSDYPRPYPKPEPSDYPPRYSKSQSSEPLIMNKSKKVENL